MATIANLMSEYTPLYMSVSRMPSVDTPKDKYDRMTEYLDYIQETPEDNLEEMEELEESSENPTVRMIDPKKTYKRVRNMTVIKPGKLKENARIAYNYFVSHNIPAASAAGIVGNLYHEDLANPLRTVNDSRGTTAYGIAGFNSDGDLPNLMRWASNNNIQGNPNFEQQLAYITHVITSERDPHLTAVIMNPSSTPEDASYAWGRYFERFGGKTTRVGKDGKVHYVGYLYRDDPEHKKRGNTSRQLYQQFHG